jgi:tRNA pseudouridine38-40 synthase
MHLNVTRRGTEVMVQARANGFLYKMVRSLTGFLMEVGIGRYEPEDTQAILEKQQRTARVRTAQPQGLFLWNVIY